MYKRKYKKPSKYDFDLVVIGSGSAGGVAAHLAAAEGKTIGIIESGTIGGDCTNYSCIPTKALLQATKTLETIQTAHQFGIRAEATSYNYQSVQTWKNQVIAATGVKNEAKAFKSENIQIIKGYGHFISPWEVSVSLRRYSARKFIVSTGGSVNVPDIPGLNEAGYITYKQASSLQNLPKSIFIIGGGAVAYEYAQIFSAFGAKVHIGEKHPHLLHSDDPEVGDCARAALESRGVRVHCAAKIVNIKGKEGHKVVTFEQQGQQHRVACEQIMLATGKTPNTDLGLENTGVYSNDDGIRVNPHMQTNIDHIFAVGDVTNKHISTQTSMQQARVAIHNAYHNKKVTINYKAIPRVIFGSPEIAVVGKTEHELRLTGELFQTSIAPIGILGKSMTSNYSNGFVKIVASHSGVVLGASIVAPHAGEMINELSLAVAKYMHACDIANIVHAFPTWSEAIRIACAKIKCI